MKNHQKAEAEMYERIWGVIDHMIQEWDITHYQATGCLHRVLHNMQTNMDISEMGDSEEDEFSG